MTSFLDIISSITASCSIIALSILALLLFSLWKLEAGKNEKPKIQDNSIHNIKSNQLDSTNNGLSQPCTHCNKNYDNDKNYKFCPNCGAELKS
jgi:NADH pyrophosphatase NudC (nudix superfamily)